MRQLKFFQIVDADRIVVAFARQNDFNKIGYDTKLCQFERSVLGLRWHGPVGRSFRLPAWDVICLPNTLRHFRDWKVIDTAAQVATGIAVLQTPGKNQIQRRSGNDSELAELGNCLREPPTGNAGAHSALNDRGKIAIVGYGRPQIISETWASDCLSCVIDLRSYRLGSSVTSLIFPRLATLDQRFKFGSVPREYFVIFHHT